MSHTETISTLADAPAGSSSMGKSSLIKVSLPWLAGSGMAAGQAFLATGCSVPKVGKCVGCGSCIVAVIALSSWALKERRHSQILKQQGRQPFEI